MKFLCPDHVRGTTDTKTNTESTLPLRHPGRSTPTLRRLRSHLPLEEDTQDCYFLAPDELVGMHQVSGVLDDIEG